MHLVFGLSPGWWNFVEDPCRGSSPVLPLERWRTLIEAAGFEAVQAFPRGSAGAQAEFGLLLASVPQTTPVAAPAQDVLVLRDGAASQELSAPTGGCDGLLVWEPSVRADPSRLGPLERLLDDHASDCALLIGDGGPDVSSATAERCALAHRLPGDGLRLPWTALHLPRPVRGASVPDVAEWADLLGQAPAESSGPQVLIAKPAGSAPASDVPAAPGALGAASATEQLVARLFGELLGKAEVGPGDDFFECGGDSLLALQLVARLRDVFRVALPVRELFESSSVAGLAALVERQRVAGAAPVELGIPVQPRGAGDIEAALAQIETLDEETLRQLALESGR
jgi:acyl carrier protein